LSFVVVITSLNNDRLEVIAQALYGKPISLDFNLSAAHSTELACSLAFLLPTGATLLQFVTYNNVNCSGPELAP
jgi:hypothetical protein